MGWPNSRSKLLDTKTCGAGQQVRRCAHGRSPIRYRAQPIESEDEMSSIDKLSIAGIRSFDVGEPQVIQFFKPLTVIVVC